MKTNENSQQDKRVAVVILNWNGRALMEEFLPSVVAYTPSKQAEIIVADNGSTDDSIEMLKTKFPMVHIIRLDRNYGFADTPRFDILVAQLGNDAGIIGAAGLIYSMVQVN